jgi:hypothetical protein
MNDFEMVFQLRISLDSLRDMRTIFPDVGHGFTTPHGVSRRLAWLPLDRMFCLTRAMRGRRSILRIAPIVDGTTRTPNDA